LLSSQGEMKQASWVTNPRSRAIIAAIAAVAAVSCVLLVISADEQEIVASGVHSNDVLSARLRKAVATLGKNQKAPRTENMQVVDDKRGLAKKGSEGKGNKKYKYGIWKKNKKKKWSRLRSNLVDLKAFAEVNKDNILDLSSHDTGILKAALVAVLESKKSELVKTWKKFVSKKEHKYNLPESLVKNMLLDLDKELKKNPAGILEVQGAKVAITGKSVGLLETPNAWKKKMTAPLYKVLEKSKLMHKLSKRKVKKTVVKFTQKDYDAMFKTKCMNLQAKENFHMGCEEQRTEEKCRQKAGCKWNKGWHGQLAETEAPAMPYVETPISPEEQAEDDMEENEDYYD